MSLKNISGIVTALIAAVAFALCGYGFAMLAIAQVQALLGGGFSIETILYIVLGVALLALAIWGVVAMIIAFVKFCQNKADEKTAFKAAKILGIYLFVAFIGYFLLFLLSGVFEIILILLGILSLVGFILATRKKVAAAIVGLCFLFLALILTLVLYGGALAVMVFGYTEMFKIINLLFIVTAILLAVTAFLPAKKEEAVDGEPKE